MRQQMLADALPVEAGRTGVEGCRLAAVEGREVVDQGHDALAQRLVAIEQTDTAALHQRHAGQPAGPSLGNWLKF